MVREFLLKSSDIERNITVSRRRLPTRPRGLRTLPHRAQRRNVQKLVGRQSTTFWSTSPYSGLGPRVVCALRSFMSVRKITSSGKL